MFKKNILKNQTFLSASKRFNRITRSHQPFWKKHQLKVVAATLLVFSGLAIAAQLTQAQPEPETEQETPQPRAVKVYQLTDNQISQTVPATIKNLNSITLVAQSAGPVSKVYYREGAWVTQGTLLVSQSTSYSGGNAQAVSRQVAAKNLELSQTSLDNTVESVSKNRELADLNRDNTEELRKITDQSIGETEEVADLLNTQVENLEDQIEQTTNETTRLALEAQLIPLQTSLNQVNQSLRQLHYQTNEDQPPTKIADISKDLVYLSTELQLKSAELSRDIAALNLKAAQIAESTTRVVAPFAGRVEKIYVEPGTYVSPGTPVAKISGEARLCLVANVSGIVATQINEAGQATFEIDGTTYTASINHVSSTPVAGNLFEVLVALPDWYTNLTYENQGIEVSLPLRTSAQTETQFVPLDAVFVTNTSRFVYVLEDGKAAKRIVDTGSIVGENIEIISGLAADDTLIIDRSVDENELVEEAS